MIIVFLGPSLPLQQAQTLLPDAYFLPPIKCGDILRVMRLKPKKIVIIDGIFERQAAVWHKEILYALQQNILVFGAASMGALRAAELADYGMIGIGEIFKAYYKRELVDDDEVAVLHEPEQFGYRALTDAMVDIRATIAAAIAQQIISCEIGQCILQQAKKLFYQARTLNKACLLAQQAGVAQTTISQLLEWSAKGGYVSQKTRDAVALLECCRDACQPLATVPNKINFSRSIYFRSLYLQVACQPFLHFKKWLPITEKVALSARLFDKSYLLTQRIAYLLAIVNSYKKINGALNNAAFGLAQELGSQDWQKENDCSNGELVDLENRLKWVNHFLMSEPSDAQITENYLLRFLKLSGDYGNYKQKLLLENGATAIAAQDVINRCKQGNSQIFKMHEYIAILWQALDRKAIEVGMVPNDDEVWKYVSQFCYKNKFDSAKVLQEWLEKNDINQNEFYSLMAMAIRFDFIVLRHNVDAFGISLTTESNWWLLDALRLTGLYAEAKRLLLNPQFRENFLTAEKKQLIMNDVYAIKHDFANGEAEAKLFIQSLSL